MDVLWAPPPTYRFMALRAVSPRAPAAFCNSSSIHRATSSGVDMWTSPVGITPTRRTAATTSVAVRTPAAPVGYPWSGPPRPSAGLLVTLQVLAIQGGLSQGHNDGVLAAGLLLPVLGPLP